MNRTIISWNVGALSGAMGLDQADVIVFFRNGRHLSAMLRRRVPQAFPGALAPAGPSLSLMEEEGIFYFIRRPPGKPMTYLCADIAAFPDVCVVELSEAAFTKAFGSGSPRVTAARYRAEVVPWL